MRNGFDFGLGKTQNFDGVRRAGEKATVRRLGLRERERSVFEGEKTSGFYAVWELPDAAICRANSANWPGDSAPS